MSDAPNLDPFGLARTWMAQWEKLVNEHGTELLAKPEAARAMQALSGAAVQLKAVSDEASGKLLAAANLPSRADFEALGARLGKLAAASSLPLASSLTALSCTAAPLSACIARAASGLASSSVPCSFTSFSHCAIQVRARPKGSRLGASLIKADHWPPARQGQ